jgi:hypothetical protein
MGNIVFANDSTFKLINCAKAKYQKTKARNKYGQLEACKHRLKYVKIAKPDTFIELAKQEINMIWICHQAGCTVNFSLNDLLTRLG